MATMQAHPSHFLPKPIDKGSHPSKPNRATSMSRPLAKSNKDHSITSAHVEKVFRVQKPKQVEAPPKIQTTAERFSEQLDECRERLYRDAVQTLQQAEGKQVDSIYSLSEQFEQHLCLLSESEAQLVSSIRDEQVKATASLGQEDSQGVSHAEALTLGQSLSTFRKLAEEKNETLGQLFDDWNNVQVEIITAAVKILGRDAVEVKKDHRFPELDEAIDTAAKEYEEVQRNATATMEEVETLQTSAKALTDDTKLKVDEAVELLTSTIAHLHDAAKAAQRQAEEIENGFFTERLAVKPQK